MMENNSLARRRRGRPLGSKNKAKEPIAKPSESMGQNSMAMQLQVLEIAAGSDVIDAVYNFANLYEVDVSVISTYGLVCNLAIYQPMGPPHSLTSCHRAFEGFFDLLSLKGNFYGPSSSIKPPPPFSRRHFISFFSREGQFFAGIVEGKVIAATTVLLGVSVIRKTNSIKLPLPPPRPSRVPLPLGHNEAKLKATAGPPEVFSSTGRSMIAYGILSPTPLNSWYPKAAGSSSTSFFK